MSGHSPVEPLMSAVNRHDADEAVRLAREVFGRTLGCWASDLLELQSRGRHLTTWSTPAQRGLRKAA